MDTNTLVCKVCGKPATTVTTELVELAPKDGWRQYAPGDRNFYCDQHAPPIDPKIQAVRQSPPTH